MNFEKNPGEKMKISSRYVQKCGFGLNFFGGGYTLAAGWIFGIAGFNNGSFEIRTENLWGLPPPDLR